jgi:pimeloyl-ACP methyl ester carboxylesterase
MLLGSDAVPSAANQRDGDHERPGQMPDKPHPVVFIHGLWLHNSSWAPWQSMFEQSGYRVHSPGWPGDQETVEPARANPDSVADKGIDDVVEHFASIIGGLAASPVLIGHSFGGMIAEKLLGQDRAAAAIAIDAAQIKGVLPLPLSSLRATLHQVDAEVVPLLAGSDRASRIRRPRSLTDHRCRLG